MLRLASSAALCPFCEARAILKPSSVSWQHSRTAATLQKRKPSRMTLSPSTNVRRGPLDPKLVAKSDNGGRAPRRKSTNSPWGGMNVTTVPRLQESRTRPSSSLRKDGPNKNNSGKRSERNKDPQHALKMQQSLSQVSYSQRNQVKESLAMSHSFDEFDLLPIIKSAIPTQVLRGMADVRPTPIQRLAIPALLGREEVKRKKKGKSAMGTEGIQQFLLAAETGSGKTLAYVLPVIDALKRAEAAEAQQGQREEQRKERRSRDALFTLAPPEVNEPDPSTARPRALVLVPTSELVDQVGNLIKALSHTVKYRTALLSANYTGKVIRSRLFTTAGIDIVVSTPHLLHSITDSDPNILSRVTHLVIDEADSLLDRSFAPTTSAIIDRASPSLDQLILCSATIPKSLDTYLRKRFPDLRRLVTPHLHAIPRRVQLSVVDIDKVPFQGNRDLAAAQVIWDIGKEAAAVDDGEGGARESKKIVVFVNEREKTVELTQYLRSKGIDAVALNRDSEQRSAADILAAFTGTGTGTALPAPQQSPILLHQSNKPTAISPADLAEIPQTSGPSSKHLTSHNKHHPQQASPNPSVSVLVTTDLLSRGIDTLPLKHVLLYDVPHSTIDFIHRLGRVGRMNRRGRGVVLVGRGDRKDVVREVREGMFRGVALV